MEPAFRKLNFLPPLSSPQDLKLSPKAITAKTDEQKEKMVTQKALEDCIGFNQMTVSLFSPSTSFFIQGLKLCMSPKRGDYDFSSATGGLMLAASPVSLLCRLVLGIPAMLGGAIATALVGTANGAERALKAIDNGIQKAQEPSAPEIQAEALTKQFVQRMIETLKSYSYSEQRFFKTNPSTLIAISLVVVAFRSRHLEGKSLNVQDDILTENAIAEQNETHHAYFKAVCELKEAIQSLKLSEDNHEAWDTLTHLLEKASSINEHDEKDLETARMLMHDSMKIGESFVNDTRFRRIWNKAI